MSNVLFYVSGHGYGHSVRIAEVIRALRAADPSAKVIVRTTAPEMLFRGDMPETLSILRASLDPDVVEQGIFRIDWRASAEKLSEFLDHRDKTIEDEAAWVRSNEIDRIVADIPFLAGEIAHAADVPCIGISNFLWDWIYEPMLENHDRGAPSLQIVRDAYARFHSLLRLPFAHPMKGIRHVVDVPLVASISKRLRSEILSVIGTDNQDDRPHVLLSLREESHAGALIELASRERDFVFLHVGEVPAACPSNLIPVTIGKGVSFADLVSVADVVVGKPGYGMMAACAANRKRLLYLPRVGFREDEALLHEAAGCITIGVLDLPEFEAGEWGQRLRDILNKPAPTAEIDLNGANVCAEYIAKQRDGLNIGCNE